MHEEDVMPESSPTTDVTLDSSPSTVVDDAASTAALAEALDMNERALAQVEKSLGVRKRDPAPRREAPKSALEALELGLAM